MGRESEFNICELNVGSEFITDFERTEDQKVYTQILSLASVHNTDAHFYENKDK